MGRRWGFMACLGGDVTERRDGGGFYGAKEEVLWRQRRSSEKFTTKAQKPAGLNRRSVGQEVTQKVQGNFGRRSR